MIVHSRIESGHLAGNLLEDPSERDLFIYLPPGYEESERRYPTTYLLHAYGDTAEGLVNPDVIDSERKVLNFRSATAPRPAMKRTEKTSHLPVNRAC